MKSKYLLQVILMILLLSCSSGEEVHIVRQSSALDGMSITSAVKDPVNNIWVGTDGSGLYKYDGHDWSQITKETSDIISNSINYIDIDKKGNLYVFYAQRADLSVPFSLIKNGMVNNFDFLQVDRYISAINVKGNYPLIGTWGSGVYILDQSGHLINLNKTNNNLFGDLIIDIVHFDTGIGGNYFVLCSNNGSYGISEIDINKALDKVVDNFYLSDNSVTPDKLFVDYEGKLFFDIPPLHRLASINTLTKEILVTSDLPEPLARRNNWKITKEYNSIIGIDNVGCIWRSEGNKFKCIS